MGNKEYDNYPDDRKLSSEAFYLLPREGHVSTTTAINMSQFEETFVPILECGEDVLYLVFSSGLSSPFGTAVIASKQL
ncbi:MAG: DegV family protein [Candidatus Fimivivens sp.]